MSENTNTSYIQPSHNHVTVTKVGVNGGDINEKKMNITELKPVNVQVYTDSEKSEGKKSTVSDEDEHDEYSDEDNEFSDDDSVSHSSQPSSATHDDDDNEDNESTTSSVSTTEILGRDPLFLVLSEFLMDEEGNNIVHILGKINKNLSRLAKALEEGTSNRHKDRKEKKKH